MKKLITVLFLATMSFNCTDDSTTGNSLPFEKKKFDRWQFEYVGMAASFDSLGKQVSSNSSFTYDEFFDFVDSNYSYFMKSIEFYSESSAFINYILYDTLDTNLNVQYSRLDNEITIEFVYGKIWSDTLISFVDKDSTIEALCTGTMRKKRGRTKPGFRNLFFGEITKNQLEHKIGLLQYMDTLFVQPFKVVYQKD